MFIVYTAEQEYTARCLQSLEISITSPSTDIRPSDWGLWHTASQACFPPTAMLLTSIFMENKGHLPGRYFTWEIMEVYCLILIHGRFLWSPAAGFLFVYYGNNSGVYDFSQLAWNILLKKMSRFIEKLKCSWSQSAKVRQCSQDNYYPLMSLLYVLIIVLIGLFSCVNGGNDLIT